MTLADSSVWIDHFRRDLTEMRRLLAEEEILIHPFVVAELALGSLFNRQATLAELDDLDAVLVADTVEVRRMIETNALYSRGIGFVDAHLLASCLLTPGTLLWTRDARLAGIARLLKCDARIPEPRSIN